MNNTERIAILQEIIKTNIILDLLGTLFFSCFIQEYLFLIPFLLLSYYGNKTLNNYILSMYQIKIIVSIYINIYLFYAEQRLWIKVALITYNPILFWYLNTIWTMCFRLRNNEVGSVLPQVPNQITSNLISTGANEDVFSL
jgi:hypothetical protein